MSGIGLELELVTDKEEEQSYDKETNNKAMEDNCYDTEESDETSASTEEVTKINPKVKQEPLATERLAYRINPLRDTCVRKQQSKVNYQCKI